MREVVTNDGIVLMKDDERALYRPGCGTFLYGGVPIYDRYYVDHLELFDRQVRNEYWVSIGPGFTSRVIYDRTLSRKLSGVPNLTEALRESALVFIPGAGGATAAEEIARYVAPQALVVANDRAYNRAINIRYSAPHTKPDNLAFENSSWSDAKLPTKANVTLGTFSFCWYGNEDQVEKVSNKAAVGSYMYATARNYFAGDQRYSPNFLTSRGWQVHLCDSGDKRAFIAQKIY